jgi:hypothetical protein
MVRFPTLEMCRRALAYLLGRFSGRSWATGEVLVPEPALAHLATEGIAFSVESVGTYGRILRLNEKAIAPTAGEPAATA